MYVQGCGAWGAAACPRGHRRDEREGGRRQEESSGARRREQRGSRAEEGSSSAAAMAAAEIGEGPPSAAGAPPSRRGSSAFAVGVNGEVAPPGVAHRGTAALMQPRILNSYALLLRAAAGQALPAETGLAVVRVFRHLHAYDLLARCVRTQCTPMHAEGFCTAALLLLLLLLLLLMMMMMHACTRAPTRSCVCTRCPVQPLILSQPSEGRRGGCRSCAGARACRWSVQVCVHAAFCRMAAVIWLHASDSLHRLVTTPGCSMRRTRNTMAWLQYNCPCGLLPPAMPTHACTGCSAIQTS